MITIGIELNHVVRDINKQILKYYSRDIKALDEDEINTKDDISKYCVFESKHDKNNFIYIDYPYEIFGCAKTIEKNLSVMITNWLSDIENIEDEDIRIVFYSLYEEALTIQSTYFFLSKTGTRVREVFFPKKSQEIWNHCDVIITANNDILKDEIPQNKILVKIERTFNKNIKSKAQLAYSNLSDVISDEEFFTKLKNL